jgi:glutaminyl-peptide cyclotransferase
MNPFSLRFVSLSGLVLLVVLLLSGCQAPATPTDPPGPTPGEGLSPTLPPPESTATLAPLPAASPTPTSPPPAPPHSGVGEMFDGQRALQHAVTQVGFGPRHPGTPGHDRMVEFILAELEKAGWDGQVQEGEMLGQPVRNVIGSRPRTAGRPWILLGAHYDTRMWADSDPDPANHREPVPGANDGASGVAVLLELARVLPADLGVDVGLVFFDAEDNGRIPGWDWIMGSRYFAASLEEHPDAVVIVDMIGDADLNIYYEHNSDHQLSQEIWQTAAGLGYTQFIPEYKYRILDDHIPFLELGIPAVDLIDFDYPYWHTLEDTLDKISAESLQAVGHTLQVWLSSR